MSARRRLACNSVPGHPRGFTLLELLVATAITVLIAATAVGLSASALSRWNRTQGRLTSEAQAREVLDRLEQDLQGILYRDDGQAWLMATVQAETSASGVWVNGSKPITASLHHTADPLADSRFGLAGVWLRFFTISQGAPVAVSYQIIRRAVTPSSPSCQYLLYRSEVSPAATLAAGYNLTSSSYTTASATIGSPGNLVQPAHGQLLADNVIDFGVRFYSYLPESLAGALVLQPIFPRQTTDLEYSAQSLAAMDSGHYPPAVADIFLRILTAEGARQITALESGRINGDWWSIAEANSRVFMRRIQLQAVRP